MPEAKAKLAALKEAYDDAVERIEIASTTLDTAEVEYENRIDQLRKSINVTHEMICETKKAAVDSEKDHERAVLNFELQYNDTVMKTEKIAAENVKLEESNENTEQRMKEQEERDNKEIEELKRQIEELKRMQKEALEALDDPEKLENYSIPEEYLSQDKDAVFLIDQIDMETNKEKNKSLVEKGSKSSKSGKSKK